MDKRKAVCCFVWIIAESGMALIFFTAKYLYWDKNEDLRQDKETLSPYDDYSYVTLKEEAVGKGPLILVNNSNLCDFAQVEEMVTVNTHKNSSYKVKDNNQRLNIEVMEPLNKMMDDFMKSKGKSDIMIVSAYRSFDEQESIYSSKAIEGEDKGALQWVAIPGGSEHHTGYAFDFGLYTSNGYSYKYDGKGIYSYILENAYKYGFILRYPEDKTSKTSIYYEPWHFRYIGRPHAYILESKGMCLEEYIEYLKSFPYDGTHFYAKDFDGTDYEIYYVKSEGGATRLPVPKDRKYSISGNNIDGFIVTAYK